MSPSFQDAVFGLCEKDTRYNPDAYFFLIEALDATVKDIRKRLPDHERHVSGKELLDGIKEHALNEFGPMAFTVFSEWGVHTTADFGEIVFNLVDAGRLGKTDTDSRDDFKDVYDFKEAFLQPFEPPPTQPQPRRTSRRRKRD